MELFSFLIKYFSFPHKLLHNHLFVPNWQKSSNCEIRSKDKKGNDFVCFSYCSSSKKCDLGHLWMSKTSNGLSESNSHRKVVITSWLSLIILTRGFPSKQNAELDHGSCHNLNFVSNLKSEKLNQMFYSIFWNNQMSTLPFSFVIAAWQLPLPLHCKFVN